MPKVDFVYCDWAHKLFGEYRFFLAKGGRGSGKTRNILQHYLDEGMETKLNVVCAREFQTSIDDSVKAELEALIDEYKLGWFYTVTSRDIRGINGTRFTFIGLARNFSKIRGLARVNRVFLEEGQTISTEVWETLVPTIREEDSKIVIAMNPMTRQDVFYQEFIAAKRSDAIVEEVNYMHNPFFPKVLEEERLACLEQKPERYAHIWLGEVDDSLASAKLLQYADLEAVSVDKLPDATGRIHIGFDVADSGTNMNAIVARQGPNVIHYERFDATDIWEAAEYVHEKAEEMEAQYVYFDAGGVGAGLKGDFRKLNGSYVAYPVLFGGSVEGPNKLFTRTITNRDWFRNRYSQLCWALRMRMLDSRRHLKGTHTSLSNQIWIQKKNSTHFFDLLLQSNQPIHLEDNSGKLVIDKSPNDEASPDMFDAKVLAFTQDSRGGLVAR